MPDNQKLGEDQYHNKLCEMIRRNDPIAFEYLYSEYSCTLYGLALRATGFKEYAEEILQDTFVIAWRSINLKDHNIPMNRWMIKNLMVAMKAFLSSKNIYYRLKADRFPDLSLQFLTET